MKNRALFPIQRFFFAICLIFGLSNSLFAQDADFVATPSTVSVSPNSPNNTFSVVIQVQINSGEIDAAEIHLDFDPTILQVNALSNLGAAQLGIPVLPNDFNDQVDNINGKIDLAYGNLFGTNPTSSFDFIQIDFEAIAEGDTSIDHSFTIADFRESKITIAGLNVLGNANDIPVEVALPNEDPVASFIATPTSGNAELMVNVDASASTDDGNIVSYNWDFGDTNTATGITASNNYLNQGNYTITLTVVDDDGATNSTTENIVVNEVVITTYTITATAGANGSIDPPTATINAGSNQTFTITPDSGYEIADVLVNGATVGAVASYDFLNLQANATISASFSLIPVQTVPEITLDATAVVMEEGTLNLPLSITDVDGDALTVTITSISTEPNELQNNNQPTGKGVEPYPFDASAFLSETGISNTAGLYSSNLAFNPTFGDGGSDGDGNGVYTITVQVDDEDGNSITKDLALTVNDTDQFISEAGITQIEAESYDDQGNSDGDDGIGVEEDGTGFVVGYTTNNDFAEYEIDVETAGLYQIDFFLGVPADGKTTSISSNGNPIGTFAPTATGGFGTFATQSITVNLPAGAQTLRFDFSGGGFHYNLDYFSLSYQGAPDLPPTVAAISDVEVAEGGTVSVNVQVDDDINSDPTASIIIYDKSVPGGTNNPFTPAAIVPAVDYTFTDNGGGSHSLSWVTDNTDGRSYEARVMASDGVNSPVESIFTIDVAQDIADMNIIPARTFSAPLPWYTTQPVLPFTVNIENNAAQNLGYVEAGDFVDYLINVPVAGTYDVEFMVGKQNAGPHTIELSEENGSGFSSLGSVNVPGGGAWQTYLPFTLQATFTNSGVQTIRLDFSGAGGVNIQEFKFTPAGNFAPVITLDDTAIVAEGGILNLPLSISDLEGDAITVTISSISTEPNELQNNNGQNGKGVEPYPFNANAFLSETIGTNIPGEYTSSLVFNPTFGDGGSDGDGNGIYTITVLASDGNSTASSELSLTVNDTNQPIAELGTTQFEAESYDNQGNSGGGDGIGVEEDGTGFVVGYTTNNDFAEYQIDVETAGTYQIDFFVGVPGAVGTPSGKTTTISSDGNPIGTFEPVGTDGFGTFDTQSITVSLPVGPQTLRFDFNGSSFHYNLDYFSFIFQGAPNFAPVIDTVADIELQEGETFNVTIQVNDDTNTSASIVIYDKSINTTPNNTNTDPYTSGGTIAGYTFVESPSGSGSYTLSFAGGIPDSRSYLARVTADDGVNTPVSETFNIDVAHPASINPSVPSVLDATTFANPLPWYGNGPQAPFTVSIENSGTNIGYINNGDFVEYLINVPTAGTYDVTFTSANGDNTTGVSTDIAILEEGNATPIGLVTVPQNGWGSYDDFTATVVFANNGLQTFRLEFDGGVNTQVIKFAPPATDTPPVLTINSPADTDIIARNVSTLFTATATDVEDDNTVLTSTIAWSSPTEPNFAGSGGSFSDELFVPGMHVLEATVTDSDDNVVTESITITVAEPMVDFNPALEGSVFTSTDVQLAWTAQNMLLFNPYDEHFHLYVNPADPNNLLPAERISTASNIGQLFWNLTSDDGIVEGLNTVVIVAAETLHVEYQNAGARDIVTFTVALPRIVPNVIGNTQADAIVAIEAADLTEGDITQANSATVPLGSVISQDPIGGSSVDAGSPVNLVISLGAVQVGVPDVVGNTQGDAIIAIEDAGLLVGTVTPINDAFIPSGTVISQDPIGGVTVDEGSPVNLIVSSGAVQTSVPNVVGNTEVEATAAIQGANLTVGTVTEENSAVVAAGEVISQDPIGGSTVDEGSLVNLVVSLGIEQVDVPDVVGNTQADAITAIEAADLTEGDITQANSATVPLGSVISQDPIGGSTVDAGSPINLVVSLGAVQVGVPNVVGNTQADATSAIEGAGLVVGTVTEENSAVVAAGEVISQDPIGGSTVDEGSPVNLVISLGIEQVDVPDVVGNTQADAIIAIEAADLIEGDITQANSATVPLGSVISQDPVGGSTADAGSPVSLVISLGAVQVGVPDVVGNTQADATTAIQGASLVVGTVTEENSDTVAAGDVISQDPIGGSTVDEGSQVNLVVSSGIAQTSVPDVVGNTEAQAITAIEGASLAVGTVTEENSDTVAEGDVISQDPTGGSTVDEGSLVNLVVSSGIEQVDVPDVVGNTEADAITAIEAAGLLEGTITEINSATVPLGSVISQNPIGGSSVDAGSPVDLVVSLGEVTVGIAQLVVLDATTDTPLFDLVDGLVIQKSDIGNTPLGIIFNTDYNPNGVFFRLSGPLTENRSEGPAPHSLFGDIGVDIQGKPFPIGEYTLIADPVSGPTITVNFSIIDVDPACVNFNAEVNDTSSPTECAGSNGAISISVSNAALPVSYDWTHDSNLDSNLATGLSAGSYTVTVTDANGCSKVLTTILSDPDKPSVSLSTFADVLDTASAFTLSGGSPAGGTYSGTGVNNGVFNPAIGAGVYPITYSYTSPTSGCTGTATRTIRVISTAVGSSQLVVLDARTDTPLFDLVDGLVIQKSEIGEIPLGVIFNTNFNPGSVFFILSGPLNERRSEGPEPHSLFGDIGVDIQGKPFPIGEYTLIANPASGPTITVNFSVIDTDPLCDDMMVEVQSETNPSTCDGANGSIVISISGAASPFIYNWSHNAALQSSTAAGLSEGTYSVTVTDANGCKDTITTTLSDPAGPSVTLANLDDVMDTDVPFNLSGGLPAGGVYSGAGVTNGVFDPSIGVGIYTITYSYTDSVTGCDGSASKSIRVTGINTELSILSYTLVNADDDTDLMPLNDGMEINIDDLPTTNLDIRVNTTADVESVRMTLSGALSRGWTENTAPYALFGNIGPDYLGGEFIEGGYSVSTTPYSLNGLSGTQGTAVIVNFQLISEGSSFFLKRVNEMIITPNPADEAITLVFDKPMKVSNIFVYDVMGRLVKTYKGGSIEEVYSRQLEVQDLPSGVYFVRTKDVNGGELQQQMAIKR